MICLFRFWKFVVTGCNYNTELKVWCSSSWSCLQTLKLQRQDSDSNVQMRLKAVLDPSAQYLILSDIDARLLYVLNIEQSENKGCHNAYNQKSKGWRFVEAASVHPPNQTH